MSTTAIEETTTVSTINNFAHDPQELSLEAFEEKYKPLKDPNCDDDAWWIVDIFDPIVKAIKPSHIWTTVEVDDNCLGTYAGWRMVNRLNYLITEVPHEFDVVFYENDVWADDDDLKEEEDETSAAE